MDNQSTLAIVQYPVPGINTLQIVITCSLLKELFYLVIETEQYAGQPGSVHANLKYTRKSSITYILK